MPTATKTFQNGKILITREIDILIRIDIVGAADQFVGVLKFMANDTSIMTVDLHAVKCDIVMGKECRLSLMQYFAAPIPLDKIPYNELTLNLDSVNPPAVEFAGFIRVSEGQMSDVVSGSTGIVDLMTNLIKLSKPIRVNEYIPFLDITSEPNSRTVATITKLQFDDLANALDSLLKPLIGIVYQYAGQYIETGSRELTTSFTSSTNIYKYKFRTRLLKADLYYNLNTLIIMNGIVSRQYCS